MTEPKITISRSKIDIDHQDADAAGFEQGYRWKLVDDLGTAESYAATKADAQTAAEAARDARSGLPPAPA